MVGWFVMVGFGSLTGLQVDGGGVVVAWQYLVYSQGW